MNQVSLDSQLELVESFLERIKIRLEKYANYTTSKEKAHWLYSFYNEDVKPNINHLRKESETVKDYMRAIEEAYKRIR